MLDPNARNPVEELAEEFLERLRRGQHPPITEYTTRHPELAGQIRELFPALVMMEEIGGPGDNSTSTHGPARATPRQLGDFRIIRQVGRGGMGIVYEAEQIALGRHVALKVLPADIAGDATRLQRFEREAKAAARLHHTNIVPVYDVGAADGVHYYAMQFIQGQALDEVLVELRRLRQPGSKVDAQANESIDRNGAVPTTRSIAQSLVAGALGDIAEPVVSSPGIDSSPDSGQSSILQGRSEFSAKTNADYYRSVARLTLQVAEALAYAHGQKILHRDIKPANLLLDAQGTVWVTDFGLAKEEGIDLTQTGDIVGTLRYMAPERFSGASDPRSDVYSLGLTLYELLALQPAFDDSDRVRLIKRITHEDPKPLRQFDRRVPRDLETIVLRACAKEPQHRYPTAAAMAADLQRFLADRPIEARRASIVEQLWRWRRRNPVMAGLTATVAALLLIVAIGSSLTALWLRAALADAKDNLDRALQAENDADSNRWRSHLLDARASRLSRAPGQRFEALKHIRAALEIARARQMPPERFAEMRNEAIAALALPDIYVTEDWPGFPAGTQNASFDDGLELYARSNNSGGVSVRRVRDDGEIASLPDVGTLVGTAWGPRGALLRSGYLKQFFEVWDVSGPQPVCRLRQDHALDGWHFRAGGSLFAAIHTDRRVRVYNIETNTVVHEFQTHFRDGDVDVCLHPSAPFVLLGCYSAAALELWDLRTNKRVLLCDPPWRGGNAHPAWSPDGQLLAVPAGDSGQIQVYQFDAETPALRPYRLIDAAPGSTGGAHLTFNRTNDRIIAFDWSSHVFLYDVHVGRTIFTTHPQAGASRGLSFDAAGRRVAGARTGDRNERLSLQSVADGREYRQLFVKSLRVSDESAPVVLPDSRLAALSTVNGLVFFDLEQGNEVAFVPVPIDKNRNGGVGIACDGAQALFTNSFRGLFRWPIHKEAAESWAIGPPVRQPFHPGNQLIAVNPGGQVIAQAMWHGYGMHDYAGGWLWQDGRLRKVGTHRSETHPGVSPDGRWVAFTNCVYDTKTDTCVWQGELGCKTCFSPDGRWLLTNQDGGRAYETGTWTPGARLGSAGWLAASPDAATAAMAKDGVIRLVEITTGRELARFEDPDRNYGPLTFSPDGEKIVVAAKDGLRVWNLRLLRAGLQELGLDWDTPSYPDRPARTAAALNVRIDEGELAAARNCNDRAWELLVGPEKVRDPLQALALARRAMDLEPANQLYLNTFGVAQYRNGHFQEAIATLERSLVAGKGAWDAFDLYFLSMCHAQLKNHAKARECFVRAALWTDTQSSLSADHRAELKQFRAEAEALLLPK